MEHSKNLGEFTLFPGLPPELRLKIRELSLPGPRVIRLQPRLVRIRPPEYPLYNIVAESDAPAHLQVNSEAGSLALKTYRLAFGTEFNAAPVYFNYAQDILQGNSRDLIKWYILISEENSNDI